MYCASVCARLVFVLLVCDTLFLACSTACGVVVRWCDKDVLVPHEPCNDDDIPRCRGFGCRCYLTFVATVAAVTYVVLSLAMLLDVCTTVLCIC